MDLNLKLIRLMLYPFLIFSLAIYVCLYLLTPLKFAYQASIVSGFICTLIVYILEKPNWANIFGKFFSWKTVLLCIPIVFLILVYGFVLSPLVKIRISDGHEFLGLTALGDYYKHLYILSAVKTEGLPPHHPFFPAANLSYYYGYYLIPSAVSSVFNLDLSRVFLIYLLFTTFIILFVVVQVSVSLFKTWYQRLLTLFLFILGTGLDIVPTLIQAKKGILTANHIEFWSQVLSLNNYIVNNLYTVLFWVPQHSFTSLFVLVTGMMLIKDKKIPILWLVLTVWFCIISSTFVSVALLIWLILAILFLPHFRLGLFVSGVLSILLLLPYIIELGSRGSILSFGFYMTPFVYLSFLPKWINYFLTFFTEYGIILVSIPIFFIIQSKINKKIAWLVTLGVLLPIILGLFVKSSGFNDYSMRSVLPSQMALPFVTAYIIGSVESGWWKKTLFVLLVLNLIPAMIGLFYEIHFRLIDKGEIDSQTSELLVALRKNPVQNLAVLSNEDWVFLIPSYGYQSVTSPRLFDSESYLSNSEIKYQKEYADLVNNIFINEDLGGNFIDVLNGREQRLQKMGLFFNSNRAFNFVVSRFRGVKTDINPLERMLNYSGAGVSSLTDTYLLYSGSSLDDAFRHLKIELRPELLKKEFIDSNNKIYLQSGFQFVIGCSKDKASNLILELNDSVSLFNKKLESGKHLCAGAIYYQPKDGKVYVSQKSEVGEIYVAPIILRKI